MHTLTVPTAGSDPAEVRAFLQSQYPWLEPWIIEIPSIYAPIACRLFHDIETILGDQPKLRYLRIVTDTAADEHYQEALAVFITTWLRSDAKKHAIIHAITRAIAATKQICKHCGHELLSKDSVDDDDLLQMPYVSLLKEKRYWRARWFCPDCLSKDFDKQLAERRARASSEVAEGEPEPSSNSSSSLSANASRKSSSTASDYEQQASDWVDDAVDSSPPSLVVVDEADLSQLEKEKDFISRDTASRIKALLKKIKSQPLAKPLAPVPIDWRPFCLQMAEDYPNFAEVMQFLRNQLALSAVAGDKVLRFAPFLLVGGPGVGKSDFMFTIADHFRTRLEIINISNAQTGSSLTGSEQYWGNTQTGTLFNTLVTGNIANPIFCLDEIDKARSDGSYNVLAALHQLLEPKQAKRFADLSMPELRFDASHVLWLATANELSQISKPIVDRFKVFEIADPAPEQMRKIARNQYRRFVTEHPSGNFFEPEPCPGVVEALSQYHPRQVRKLLEQCFGQAAYDERTTLTVEDVELATNRASTHSTTASKGIGFLATV